MGLHAPTRSRSANWAVKIALVVTVALVTLEFVAGTLATAWR